MYSEAGADSLEGKARPIARWDAFGERAGSWGKVPVNRRR
jgi:hypothetical protein